MSAKLELLLQKIDQFIRRYYLNQLIKGSLFFGAGFLALFLFFVFVEYFGYLSTGFRFVLFYGFLTYNLVIFVLYVVLPLLGMVRIGRQIGPEEAARVLEKHFPDEVSDKVTNVLQLKKYLDSNTEGAELIMAGIDQKAGQASLVPFTRAIPLKGNMRFLPYVIVPLFFVGLFWFLQPALLVEPARRIVQYDVHFERPRPFTMVMTSPERGFRNEDHEIVMEARGEVVPSEAILLINGTRYRMREVKTGVFSHNMRNLQNDLRFQVEASGFIYGPYSVDVADKASFSHFKIEIDYPAYTDLESEVFTNKGDFSVIRGSQIEWTFHTMGHAGIQFYINGDELAAEPEGGSGFRVRTTASNDFNYKVYAYNETYGKGDSLNYKVQVRPDAHPRIAVEEHRDDVLLAHLFYRGTIEDDFGFTDLRLMYRILDGQSDGVANDIPFMEEALAFDPHLRNQTFYHHFDLQSVYVRPGETVELYFKVYDNDLIGGPKYARSQLFAHYIPTEEEILAQRQDAEEQMESGLREGLGEVQGARDQIESLRRQLLDSDRMGWEQREAVQELLEKRKEVEQRMHEISDMKKESETRTSQFLDTNEKIREKQQELQKLFDEVLSDELKDLFDRISQELDRMNRDQVYEMLDQMEFEFRDLEMQLDRALEMFRQFAMERLLQESMDRLEKLVGDLDDLQSSGGEISDEENQREQQRINSDFDRVQGMMDEFRKNNESLNRPRDIEDTSQQEEDIMDQLRQALEQLEMNQPSGASQHQQDAGRKMKSMLESLQQMQASMFMRELAEDARAIRMLLENLLRSSFAQEDLMIETRSANVNDPGFPDLIREQRKIQSDLEMIQDSLVALSKRQVAIQSFVNREIAELHTQLRQGIDHMINRRRPQAASRQQFVMTHINNLALMLNESLQNINQQMGAGQGMGEDSQAGEGSPSFESLREMQERLNEMMQQFMDGQQPMPGETGESPMSISEQMARMAAEQEAIRNKLRDMADEMRNQGQQLDQELDGIRRDMEQSELDILRKDINAQTIDRQQRILTRLLEHERAEMEREQEERREGTTAENYEISNPEAFFEYNRIREREVEMLRSLPPGLRPFYRSLVEKYFLHVE